MADDDELTAAKVCSLLLEKYPTLDVSLSTVKRARMELGWTAKVRCVDIGSIQGEAS